MIDFFFQFYIVVIYMSGCNSSERTLCECDKLNSVNINTIVQCRACTTCVAGSSNGCNNESRKFPRYGKR